MSKLTPQLLDILKRLAEGIVAIVGPTCEVVVHDFADLEHSVVVVAGNVTGRKTGAPVPDLFFTSEELNRETPDQINYRTRLGDRELQNSTIWIRDETGEPIGAVCIMVDYTDLRQMRGLVEKLSTALATSSDMIVSDTFARDTADLLDHAVAGFLRQRHIPDIEAMSYEEKLCLIKTVEERGLFKIRGAVNRLADMLNVSRASIYNYRASLKNGDAPDSGDCLDARL